MGVKLIKTPLKNGSVLVELEGLGGEADFYRVFDHMNQVIKPDASRDSVDSLCVMGTFRKDGISVRMSSEGINEWVSFQYDAAALSDEDNAKVARWLDELAAAL